MSVALIPPDHVRNIWPEVTGMITEAIAYASGRYLPKDIYRETTSGELQLWVVFDDGAKGIAITRVCDYPSRRTLAIDFLGGREFVTWVDEMEETLVSYAKDLGCSGLESYSRKGMVRLLEKRKWKSKVALVEREVE